MDRLITLCNPLCVAADGDRINEPNKNMDIQKTITIGGKKFTASTLRKLHSVELNGGDSLVTIPNGLQVAYRLHAEAVAVINYGAVYRSENFGGIVALLAI